MTRRQKAKRAKNWTSIKGYLNNGDGVWIKQEQIINEKHNPLCRGIMFALHEKLWNLGYLNMYFMIEQRHFSSVKKSADLFLSSYNDLNYLNKQQMNIILLPEEIQSCKFKK